MAVRIQVSRCGGPGRWVLAAACACVLALPCAAQGAPQDTVRPPADTAPRAPADTGARAPGDTARGAADTARAASDTTRPPADTAAVRPPAPTDSILSASCAGATGLAPDLLIVVFQPDATSASRDSVARAVGGELAGAADAVRPGGTYIKVPGGAYDPTVADRLIMLPPVQEVGPTRCPE